MRSGEEIQAALRGFVTKWSTYAGSEKAEAQTFLNELFACYGTDRQAAGALFEDFKSSAGFMDLHWPGICIVEMKAPTVALATAREQVERYWRESSDSDRDIPAARWVVICSFLRFEVWEPGRFPVRPRIAFDLADLPDRYDSLAFLSGLSVEPVFVEHHRVLTTQAAEQVATFYRSVVERNGAQPPDAQRFILQSVWCMFAEDLGMLDGYPFQRTVQALIAEPHRSSAADLGYLFRLMNKKTGHPGDGQFAGTKYVNGELFAEPAEIDLMPTELRMLRNASEFDWRKVDPTIFGSLMEGVLGRERRWQVGAHYTHEADIMKIVTPTIVRPWRKRIDATASPTEARDLLDELCSFRVLDPACGCGNFLYVAYHELRGLEAELKARIKDLAATKGMPVPPEPWPHYRLANLQGIDIERVAVHIARVTLWMGHRQMIERYGRAEDPLPLTALPGIRQADALQVDWPETDAVIGNPPFLGSQWIRGALGDDYAEWLAQTFDVGLKDFCVYWFRKAHRHLRPGQRAGLVGTNSVAQNRARSASLEYITTNSGVITDAVSSQKWPGEAKVHVSLVNWVKEPEIAPTDIILDGSEVAGINSSLHAAEANAWSPTRLMRNRDHCFQGMTPVGAGFLLSPNEAERLLGRPDADYSLVVKPYLTGDDIANDPRQKPGRWIIDFGARALEKATQFPAALEIVRIRVKPQRDLNRDRFRQLHWWRYGRPYDAVRDALSEHSRFIAANRVGKRLLLAWYENLVVPSDKAQVFAFDDDYSMGVLLSRTHIAWAWARSSTLKADLNYTPTSAFMTFPWPDLGTNEHRERVADASRRMLARRSEICQTEQIGLTKLYNLVDDGAYADLTALHRELDEAVAACYGWPKSVAQEDADLVRRLTALNREIAEGGRPYDPFPKAEEER